MLSTIIYIIKRILKILKNIFCYYSLLICTITNSILILIYHLLKLTNKLYFFKGLKINNIIYVINMLLIQIIH